MDQTSHCYGVVCRPHGTPPASDIADAPLHKQDLWREWDTFVEPGPTRDSCNELVGGFRSTCGFENLESSCATERDYRGAVALRFLHETGCFLLHPGRPGTRLRSSLAEPVFDAVLAAIEERRKSNRASSVTCAWNLAEGSPDFVKGFRAIRPCSDFFLESQRHALCGSAFVRVRASRANEAKGRYTSASREGTRFGGGGRPRKASPTSRNLRRDCERQEFPRSRRIILNAVSLFRRLERARFFLPNIAACCLRRPS